MVSSQSSDSTPMKRRTFIQVLLGFSVISTAAGVIVPIVSYLLPKPADTGSGAPVDIGKEADFPVGSSTVVSVNNKPVIIVNTKAGGLKAFSAICPHLGCVTQWDARRATIHCPCHDGFFNPVTGAVVSGPPPRGLPAYELAVKEGKVLIGKPQGQIFGG